MKALSRKNKAAPVVILEKFGILIPPKDTYLPTYGSYTNFLPSPSTVEILLATSGLAKMQLEILERSLEREKKLPAIAWHTDMIRRWTDDSAAGRGIRSCKTLNGQGRPGLPANPAQRLPKSATALPDLADRWLTKAALSVAVRRGRPADGLSPGNSHRMNKNDYLIVVIRHPREGFTCETRIFTVWKPNIGRSM